jgi:hypothetical protein
MSALARWDAFLAQIEGRHGQVRAEAEASARAFIANVAGGGDYLPMSHQLMAVRSRLQELETMITDTWHAKVSTAISDEGLDIATRDAAFAKGEALKHRLDDEREELEPRIFAELARQRFACGLGESVAAIAAHAVAQEAVVTTWRAMRRAERALNAIRPPRTLEPIKAYERAQIAYWRAYLEVRARYEPILARDPALEIRSRMEQWYVSSVEYEPAWVAAGRPREPIT